MLSYYLKYGSGKLNVNIDKGRLLGILQAKEFHTPKSEKKIIRETLGKKIENFVGKNEQIGIAVPDNTRNAGVKIYLPIVIKKLLASGILKENITIFIASGAHKPMNKVEIGNLVSRSISNSFKVICNNVLDRHNFYFAGRTLKGTKILINRQIKKVDKLIATSSVLYHYFAGYGGGPKILMPGLAGLNSIAANHRMTLKKNGEFNNKCRNGNLQNNPVYSDIAESVKFFPPTLYLGTVLNDRGKIIRAFCGDIIKEHKKAAKFIDKIYKIRIKQKADVVICSAGGYPKDINLIQTHKAIHNAYPAVKKNGILMCLAECRDGISSKTFLRFFGYRNIAHLKKNILNDYSLNAQTALSFWNKILNVKILLVSNLKYKEIQPLIDKGLRIFGKYNPAENYFNRLKNPTFYIVPAANSINIES